MTSAVTNPVELRSRGFQALVKELGWVNAVRFPQSTRPEVATTCGKRDAILPAWDAATLVKKALRQE